MFRLYGFSLLRLENFENWLWSFLCELISGRLILSVRLWYRSFFNFGAFISGRYDFCTESYEWFLWWYLTKSECITKEFCSITVYFLLWNCSVMVGNARQYGSFVSSYSFCYLVCLSVFISLFSTLSYFCSCILYCLTDSIFFINVLNFS